MDINIMAEELFLKADIFIADNQIQEALEILEDILTIEPHFGKAYNHIGWIYETKYSVYEKAEENYKLAIELAPNYPATYLNYAYMLSHLRRYDDLKPVLEKAIVVPGINLASVYNEFGMMYESQGQFIKATDYYKKFIQIALTTEKVEAGIESISRCQRKTEILL